MAGFRTEVYNSFDERVEVILTRNWSDAKLKEAAQKVWVQSLIALDHIQASYREDLEEILQRMSKILKT